METLTIALILSILGSLIVGAGMFFYWLGFNHGEDSAFEIGKRVGAYEERHKNMSSSNADIGSVFLN